MAAKWAGKIRPVPAGARSCGLEPSRPHCYHPSCCGRLDLAAFVSHSTPPITNCHSAFLILHSAIPGSLLLDSSANDSAHGAELHYSDYGSVSVFTLRRNGCFIGDFVRATEPGIAARSLARLGCSRWAGSNMGKQNLE